MVCFHRSEAVPVELQSVIGQGTSHFMMDLDIKDFMASAQHKNQAFTDIFL